MAPAGFLSTGRGRLAETNPALGERMDPSEYARREIRAILQRYDDRGNAALKALGRVTNDKPCPESTRPFNPKD